MSSTTPLSPGYLPLHFDSLRRPPSPRAMQTRTPSLQRRPQGLQLPHLPRFHPANFSNHSTPDGASATSSPQPPMSPRAHQRMYSDAQKHLYLNQREALSAAARVTSPGQVRKPLSPRLQPLGSPGPVTPLELEGQEGYLIAGARNSSSHAATASKDIVETFIKQEKTRRQGPPNASSPRSSSR